MEETAMTKEDFDGFCATLEKTSDRTGRAKPSAIWEMSDKSS
jgi:hypothetical protein